jgi:hypothetical protein
MEPANRTLVMSLMAGAVCLSTISCAPASTPAAPPMRASSARLADPLAGLPRIGDVVVVDSDLRMTEAEAAQYIREQNAGPAPSPSDTGPPVGHDEGFLIVAESGVWPVATAANLTFAIDRATFKRDDQYQKVRTNLEAAAKEWSNLCPTCGVRFVHVDDLDANNPAPGKVVFVARYRDVGGVFIAASFFANDPGDKRFLDIDPSYFKTSFNPVGVFRHELGHVLGYRHEHIRGIPGCTFEGGRWISKTPYDPKSVMHYLCGGGGSVDLIISDLDRTGHESAYGGRAP